ncbi:Uncharacterized protein Fot_21549 [Forsythia ovata]|uniref:Uncharacterized protein n=1 Tax=Forsythia ovata TaxID=205694 RepID=A0ABD1UX19_9LAMI
MPLLCLREAQTFNSAWVERPEYLSSMWVRSMEGKRLDAISPPPPPSNTPAPSTSTPPPTNSSPFLTVPTPSSPSGSPPSPLSLATGGNYPSSLIKNASPSSPSRNTSPSTQGTERSPPSPPSPSSGGGVSTGLVVGIAIGGVLYDL